MRVVYLLLLALFSPASWAGVYGEVENLSELALLPTYCKGTQQVRLISNDPKPIADYVALYGEAYIHTHQYCWGLNKENKLPGIRDENHRKNQMITILENFQYVLDRAPLTFTLLPDIYISKARILFKMERDVDAVGVLFTLTQIKPGYSPAYAQLGDYYQRIGDKHNAIKFYELGLINTNKENSKFFIKKIKKIDPAYKAPPIKDIPKIDSSLQNTDQLIKDSAVSAPPNLPDQTLQATPASPPTRDGNASPADQAEKPNPYCRFCPEQVLPPHEQPAR